MTNSYVYLGLLCNVEANPQSEAYRGHSEADNSLLVLLLKVKILETRLLWQLRHAAAQEKENMIASPLIGHRYITSKKGILKLQFRG